MTACEVGMLPRLSQTFGNNAKLSRHPDAWSVKLPDELDDVLYGKRWGAAYISGYIGSVAEILIKIK